MDLKERKSKYLFNSKDLGRENDKNFLKLKINGNLLKAELIYK